MNIKPDCLCKRGPLCGLVAGKLDKEDYANIWLPCGYLNRIKGSSFLEMRKEQGEFDFPDRKEAVKAYLSDAKKGFNRYNRLSSD